MWSRRTEAYTDPQAHTTPLISPKPPAGGAGESSRAETLDPPVRLLDALDSPIRRADIRGLLGADLATIGRYEPDGDLTTIGTWHTLADPPPHSARYRLGGNNVATLVYRTGRPSQIDDYRDASGAAAAFGHAAGYRSAFGSPIVVAGQLWGVITVAFLGARQPAAGIEQRLGVLAALLATAIASAADEAAISQLAAEKVALGRIIAAGDNARRRIERDLHDGGQQRLVHAVILLKLAVRALTDADPEAAALVVGGLHEAEQANADVRELAHGILPSILTEVGLSAAIHALADRCVLPVTLDVSVTRLPEPIETTAYFLINEALTNAVKHATATHATISVGVQDAMLRIEIADDGTGGAQSGPANDLTDLTDRVTALDGHLEVDSSTGGGTRVRAALPIGAPGQSPIEVARR